MKCGARVALGIAGGYFLGRTKKMKLALMLGGMAAGRRAGGPGQLLAQGTKLLGQSPELGRLTDEIRGRLLEAGKGAAVAVVTRQVEALTDRLVTQVGTATEAGGRTVSDVGERAGGVGRTVGGLGRRRSGDEPEPDLDEEEEPDQYDEDESDLSEEEPSEDGLGEEPEAEEDEAARRRGRAARGRRGAHPRPKTRRRRTRRRTTRRRRTRPRRTRPRRSHRRRPAAARTGVRGRRPADATGRAAGSAPNRKADHR